MSDDFEIIRLFPKRTETLSSAYTPAQKWATARRFLGTILLLFSCLCLLLSAILGVAHYVKMTHWTRVEATVISGKFRHQNSDCGVATTPMPCDQYYFTFTVSYPVAGEVRESQIESLPFRRLTDVMNWANLFPPGHRLQIAYNPSNPGVISLVEEPAPLTGALGVLKFALCLLIPGVVLILSARAPA